MKTIQSHKLGSHTFPLNAQADVSCSSGGLQAGAHSGPLCGCTTETNPSARSGARVRKMGSRPGLCASFSQSMLPSGIRFEIPYGQKQIMGPAVNLL